MVALELLLTEAVVTMKVTDVAAACTVTDGATVSVVLEFARVMVAPPEGAGWVTVTVQVLEALAPILDGVQAIDETSMGATRLTVVLAEPPL
jgi:hypothetical protein